MGNRFIIGNQSVGIGELEAQVQAQKWRRYIDLRRRQGCSRARETCRAIRLGLGRSRGRRTLKVRTCGTRKRQTQRVR